MAVPKELALPNFRGTFTPVGLVILPFYCYYSVQDAVVAAWEWSSFWCRSLACLRLEPDWNLSSVKNSDQSDSQEPIQALQGVPFALRKVIGLAKIRATFTIEPIDPSQPDSPFRFLLQSSIQGLGFIGAAPLRAVGFPTENRDERVLDGSEVEKDEPVIGKTKSRIWMCLLADVLGDVQSDAGHETGPVDDFLKQGWDRSTAGKTRVVRLSIEGVSSSQATPSWRNEQIWGIQEGRWTARIAFTKGLVRETARLVYDYVG